MSAALPNCLLWLLSPCCPCWSPRSGALHSWASSDHETRSGRCQPGEAVQLPVHFGGTSSVPGILQYLQRLCYMTPWEHGATTGTSGEGLCAGPLSVGSTRLMENRVTSLSYARRDLALLKILLKVLFETESLIHH